MLNSEPMFECQFTPYRAGMGPRFILKLFETGRRNAMGRDLVGYQLLQRDNFRQIELFAGADIGCSPLHAIDSVACAHAVMRFLTLRPGDIDADYFDNYTQAQQDFCARHAESLSCEVMTRWCDQNGNLKRQYQ